MGTEKTPPPADRSPDSEDRLNDFLSRHGGAGSQAPTSQTFDAGLRGRSETYAADGYRLRRDWSSSDSRQESTSSEIPPHSGG